MEKGLPFALGSGIEIRDRAKKYLYLLLRDIMWLQKVYQRYPNSQTGFRGPTKLETMILLPWSNTLVASTAGAAAVAAFPLVAGALVVVCLVAAFASVLFTRRPRLPLRMPRLRGLEEMMSACVRNRVFMRGYHQETDREKTCRLDGLGWVVDEMKMKMSCGCW